MRSVDMSEAPKQLTALLDDVERGAVVIITRRGRPVARLTPIESGFDRAQAQRAAEGLRAASKGQTLGGLSLQELIGR